MIITFNTAVSCSSYPKLFDSRESVVFPIFPIIQVQANSRIHQIMLSKRSGSPLYVRYSINYGGFGDHYANNNGSHKALHVHSTFHKFIKHEYLTRRTVRLLFGKL